MHTPSKEKNSKYFESFYDQLIKVGASEIQPPYQFAVFTLLDTFSNFSTYLGLKFSNFSESNLDRVMFLCQQHVEKLCRILRETEFTKSKIESLSARRELSLILESLVSHIDFLHVYPHLDEGACLLQDFSACV